MPGHDQLAKDLVRTFFRNFLDLAAPEAAGRLRPERASFLDTQSSTDWPAGRRQEMDLLVRVPSRSPGQKPVLIHVEVERQARTRMALRMWLYYMQLRLRHGLLVVPILLNLKGGAPGVSRPLLAEGFDDPETARFRFRSFSVSGCRAEEYLERPEPLAWALAALMRRGRWSRAEHRMACIRRIAGCRPSGIAEVPAGQLRRNLSTIVGTGRRRVRAAGATRREQGGDRHGDDLGRQDDTQRAS